MKQYPTRAIGDSVEPDEIFILAFDGKRYVAKKVDAVTPTCEGCVFSDTDNGGRLGCSSTPNCEEGLIFIPFKKPKKRKVHVCTTCGSPRVLNDAFVSVNDPSDIRIMDDTHCEDCGKECTTTKVRVAPNFDITTDVYNFK